MGMAADDDIDPQFTHFFSDSRLVPVGGQEIFIAPMDIQHDGLGAVRLHVGDLALHIGIKQFQIGIAEPVDQGV